jgi:hypothetical protein
MLFGPFRRARKADAKNAGLGAPDRQAAMRLFSGKNQGYLLAAAPWRVRDRRMGAYVALVKGSCCGFVIEKRRDYNSARFQAGSKILEKSRCFNGLSQCSHFPPGIGSSLWARDSPQE